MDKKRLIGCLVAAGMLAVLAATARAEVVGRVLLSAGDTFATRAGRDIRLAYGTSVEDKDVLRTGAASTLQVRFNDESIVSLRENSQFGIEDYKFTGKEDGLEKAFFRLVKGGFRTVTGLIGRTNKANYAVRAETATIGIRGTDYAVRDCKGDCGAGVKDGLYGSVLGVSHGTNKVSLANNAGEFTFAKDQHFYIADINTRPEPLLQPPSFVSVKPRGKGQAAGGSGGEETGEKSGASAESRPSGVAPPSGAIALEQVADYQQTETFTSSGLLAALQSIGTIGIVGVDDGGAGGAFASTANLVTGVNSSGQPVLLGIVDLVELDDGDVFSAQFTGVGGANGVDMTGCIDAANPACFAGTGQFTASWGHWGSYSASDSSGSFGGTFAVGVPGSLGFHYLITPDLTPFDVITTRTGTFTFTQVAAGTTPTNNLGEFGSLGGSILVTFGATPSATYNGFSMSFPSFSHSTASPVPLALFNDNGKATFEFFGLLPGGTCSGAACASVSGNPVRAEITGAFVGPNADHLGATIGTIQSPTSVPSTGLRTGAVQVFSCAPYC